MDVINGDDANATFYSVDCVSAGRRSPFPCCRPPCCNHGACRVGDASFESNAVCIKGVVGPSTLAETEAALTCCKSASESWNTRTVYPPVDWYACCIGLVLYCGKMRG